MLSNSSMMPGDAFPVQRFTVAAHPYNQQEACKADDEADDFVAVQFVVTCQQMGKQYIDKRRHAHDDG